MKKVLGNVPKRLRHSVNEVPDVRRPRDEVENVASMIEDIESGNRTGDLVTDPHDWFGDDPVELARKIQSGGSW